MPPLSANFGVSFPFSKNSFDLRSVVTNNKFNKNIDFLMYSFCLGSFVCLHLKTALDQPSAAEMIVEEENEDYLKWSKITKYI